MTFIKTILLNDFVVARFPPLNKLRGFHRDCSVNVMGWEKGVFECKS